MAQERIDSLISDKALKEFDQLVEKSDKAVASFEKLIAQSVQLNNSLGGATKSFSETNEQLKKMAENEQQVNAASKQVLDTSQKLVSAQNAQNLALTETVKVANEYKNRLNDLKAEQKTLSEEFKTGKISIDTYKAGLTRISTEEAKVKNASQQLNGVLRTQVKEQQAAAGSVDQLRAKLLLLQKTFDGLSASQRKSPIGTEVKKQLNQVNGELAKLEQSTGRFQRNVGNYGSALNGIGASLGALGGVLFGLSSVSQFFGSVIKEAEDAEKATARFKNTLEGVGRLDSFERLSDEAVRLATSFGYLDNDDIIDVFDKLTTYGKLTEKQITQLTPVIIDFAAKAQISLADATEKIIGGLEGQGKALKQYGINMKDGETVTERLGIVMTDLKGRVDGAAVAFGDTLAGGVAKSQQHLRDLEETIGTGILPIWNKIKIVALEAFAGIIQGINGLLPALDNFFDSMFRKDEYQRRQRLKGMELEKQAVKEGAQSFVASIKGNVDVLEEQLKISESLLQSDVDRGRTTGNYFAAQKTQAVIALLKTEITLRKEKNSLANKVEGKGTTKTISSTFFDQELKDQAAAFKKLSEADTFYLTLRLNARKLSAQLEQQILEGNREKDIINANGDAQKLKDIAIKFAYEQKKIAQTLGEDLVTIRKSANDRIVAADRGINDAFIEEAKLAREMELNELTAANEKRVVQIATARDTELELINKQFDEGILSEKQYQEKRLQAEFDYAKQVLDQQIKFTEAYLALARLRGEDTTSAEAKLANYKMQLSDLETKHIIDNNAKKKKSDEERIEEITKSIQKVQEIFGQVTDLIGGFIQARVDREKNAIQDLIDLNDDKAKREIDAVAASTLSEQEKANRITIINARSQAQKEQLERRQRQLDLQRARFDKAAGIGKIIINTAMAVTHQMTSGDVYTALARALGAATFGALQLALAVAQPLPKFAHGTEDAPGGPAWVGDAHRSELVVTPDGQLIRTPAVPTVMNVPKHSIVLPDARKILEAGIHPRWGGSVMQKNDNSDALINEIRNLNKTVKNQRGTNIYMQKSGWNMIVRDGGNQTNYLNRNL